MPRKQPSSTSKVMHKMLRGNTARERTLHRLHSIALVLAGLTAKNVAMLYGDSPRAVAYWVTKFQADGYESLEDRERPGRPSRLNDLQMKRLRSFVNGKRKKKEHVNAAMLAAHIETSCKVRLTERQCWRILKGIV